MPLPHEEVTKKQPRRQFRKERKRATRQRRRQLFAQARDQRVDDAEKLKQHSEHLQQKRLWEEREQRYELINAVRRKAEETERQAREAAKQKWRDALLRMLPPVPEPKSQQTIRMPNFVSSDKKQEASWP